VKILVVEASSELPPVTVDMLFAAYQELARLGYAPAVLRDLLPLAGEAAVAELLETALGLDDPNSKAALVAQLLPHLQPEQRALVRRRFTDPLTRFTAIFFLMDQFAILPPQGRAEALRRLFTLLRPNPRYFAYIVSSLAEKLTSDELAQVAEELTAITTPDVYAQPLALIGRHLSPEWRERILQACREITDGNLRAVTLHALVVNDLDPDRLEEAAKIARDIADLGGKIRAHSHLFEFAPHDRRAAMLSEAVDALLAAGPDDRIAGIGLGGLAPHFTTAQATALFRAFRPTWDDYVNGYWLSCLVPEDQTST